MLLHKTVIRFLIIGSAVVVMAPVFEVHANSYSRTVNLCDNIKATVTVISQKKSKNTVLSAINYAVTGARESCQILSDRGSRSQTRFINGQAGQGTISVGPDLQYLLPRVIRLSRLTGGAFDPMAWSYQSRANYQDIYFDPVGRKAMIKRKGGSISFRGLLRGYLTDRIAARLRKQGIHRYFIEVGGSAVKSSGQNVDSSWMAGIPDPQNRHAESICRIALVNRAMVTVGANPWEVGSTSFPGSADYASVTVLSSRAYVAEALANAAMVSGDRAKAILQGIQGVGAILISHQGSMSVIGSVPAACLQ